MKRRFAARSLPLRFRPLLGLSEQPQAVDVSRPHSAKVRLQRPQSGPVGAVQAAGSEPALLDKPRLLEDAQVLREEWKGTWVTWDIKPAKDGGHEVTFNHDGWPEELPPADLASVSYAWGRIVGRLKKFAETGKPVPYFP